ncbi:NAD(P)-binding protein [Kineococcus sp. SYSU DK005]|uniref:NAD(P)-binding protein n=1 Tax=Kineococcus sp. SYSU DK005 TaxID=3383126 RepID=UPI003D7DE0B0
MSAPTLERRRAGTGADLPVVVAGAGSRGLAAAEALLDAGLAVVVVEAADAPGGLARCAPLWGLPHSLAAHGLPCTAAPDLVAQWLDLSGGHVERTRARHAVARGGRVTGTAPRPAGRLARAAARLAPAAGEHDVLSPVAGTGALWAELVRRLRSRGATVLLGTTALALEVAAGRVGAVRVRDADGERRLACRAVVDALPEHRRLLAPGSIALTRSLDTHLVHLLVEAPDGAPVGPAAHDVTVDVTAGPAAGAGPAGGGLRTARLTPARAWRPRTLARRAGAVLRAELRSTGDDALSALDEAGLRRLVQAELPALGVTAPVRVLDDAVLHLPASVPVPGGEAGADLPAGLVRAADGPVPGAGDGLAAGRAAAARVPLPVR